MMQMLAAGGMPVLTDARRAADVDNPRGYFEFEPVKTTQHDASWLGEASGKAVKMVHLLLMSLPPGRDYRVVFMRRDLDEVVTSQRKMLDRLALAGAKLSNDQLKALYADQIDKVLRWMAERRHFRVIEISYAALIRDPAAAASKVNAALSGNLDERAMVTAVDPALYRNRKQG